MRHALATIQDVSESQLCCGCGACASAWPEKYQMADVPTLGRRPVERAGGSVAERRTPNAQAGDERKRSVAAVCPGIDLQHTFDSSDPAMVQELQSAWGPVLEVWEGYAVDPEIRRMGSSGGAATALALYCIERAGMHGVLHTAARDDKPYLNHTVLSRSREDLLAATGSRYAPASPCEDLGRIARAPKPCVFIGKPCDVAGAQKLRKVQPELDAKLGLTIAFFCAGTPSTQGTLDLLARVGVDDPDSVTSMRYRGDGWPGQWTVAYSGEDGQEQTASMSYEESWGFLQRYRQWRCYICPDHTGEFADIAVGDPWYRQVEPGESGKSLIIVRTRRGLETLHAAVAAGYVALDSKDDALLPRSQPNLLKARGRLWGQLTTLGALGVPRPRYLGFATFGLWRTQLSSKEKAQSFYGTMKRVFTKRLYRRQIVPGITRQRRRAPEV